MKTIVVAAYVRTSKEYRNVERISISQQIEDAKRLAEERDWELTERHIYADPDVSSRIPPSPFADGQKKHRKGLTSLMRAIENGEVKLLIVRKRDRIFRKTEWALRFYSFLKKHNCGLVATHEHLPGGNDASGMFALTVLSAAAELELEKTRENVKAAKDYARRHGLKMGPVFTPGYQDGANGEVKENKPVADVVREVFKRYAGGEPVMSITRWLNTAHRDKARKRNRDDERPAHWHAGTVWQMLRNRYYAGLTKDGSEKSKLYPAIIDPDLFWAVQRTCKSQRGSRVQRNGQRFLMRGLLYCGYCGQSMQVCTFAGKDKHLRLFGCGYTAIPHTKRPFLMREDRWVNFLRTFFENSKYMKSSENPKAVLLQAELDAHNDQLEELAEDLAKKKLTVAGYTMGVTKIEEAKAKTQRQIAALPRPTGYEPIEWDKINHDERRRHLQMLVERVEVFQDRAVVHFHKEENRAESEQEKPLIFPVMKQAQPGRGVRPGTCLMPDDCSRSVAFQIMTEIYERKYADMKAELIADWSELTTPAFYRRV